MGEGIEIRDFIFLGKEDHCRASHFQGWGGGWWESLGTHLRPPNKPENKHGASSTGSAGTGVKTGPRLQPSLPLNRQLSWLAEHSSRGGGWCKLVNQQLPLLGCRLSPPQPRSLGQKAQEAGNDSLGKERDQQTPEKEQKGTRAICAKDPR